MKQNVYLLSFTTHCLSHSVTGLNSNDIKSIRIAKATGLLKQTITWYKIRHAGGQAHYYSRTGTLKQRPVKVDWLWSLCFNVTMRE